MSAHECTKSLFGASASKGSFDNDTPKHFLFFEKENLEELRSAEDTVHEHLEIKQLQRVAMDQRSQNQLPTQRCLRIDMNKPVGKLLNLPSVVDSNGVDCLSGPANFDQNASQVCINHCD